MNDDRDGHARARDLFKADAQDEARDSVGGVMPERKPRRRATGRRRVGCAIEDGILLGEAMRKVEPSAVAERGELQRLDELDPTWFFEELVEEDRVFGHVNER
jgi:hypothetical protein